MGTQTALSVDEYLRTSFPGPDREYRDGELVERALPDFRHAETQTAISAFFFGLRHKYSLYTGTEGRMKLRERRYLIPDVVVFHREYPGLLPDTPPLVAVEILSPDDRMSDVLEKLAEYRTWGVPHVWLVDPATRCFYTCDPRLREVPVLEVPELGIQLTAADAFA